MSCRYANRFGWGYDNVAMVEAYIAGRELTCAVLNDAPTDVMEIVPTNGFTIIARNMMRAARRIFCPQIFPPPVREIRTSR